MNHHILERSGAALRKILYCHPPPGITEDEFNEDTRRIILKRAEGKKPAPTTRVVKGADTFVPSVSSPQPQDGTVVLPAQGVGPKSHRLDQEFFTNDSSMSSTAFTKNGQGFSRSKLYPHQNSVANDGTTLSGRRARIASVLASAGAEAGAGKKHKKIKREKQRSGRGYD